MRLSKFLISIVSLGFIAFAVLFGIIAAAHSNWDNAESTSNGNPVFYKFSLKKICRTIEKSNGSNFECYSFINGSNYHNNRYTVYSVMTTARNSVLAMLVFTIIFGMLGLILGVILFFKEFHRFAKFGVPFFVWPFNYSFLCCSS